MSRRIPTMYEDLSQKRLHGLFSTEVWAIMSFDQRLAACQEVENRYADEHDVEPCIVTHTPMNGSCYGWQNRGTITLNTYLLRDGQFNTSYRDPDGNIRTVRTDAPAPGWSTLDTVYHEGTHGLQEATGRMPHTYIDPSMDRDLYRIQDLEAEAYDEAKTRTLDTISAYEDEFGITDASSSEYYTYLNNDSYQIALDRAAQHYADPDISETLRNVINDRENQADRLNTTQSYEEIRNMCDRRYGPVQSTESEKIASDEMVSQTTQDHSVSQNNGTSAEPSAIDDMLGLNDHGNAPAPSPQAIDEALGLNSGDSSTNNTSEKGLSSSKSNSKSNGMSM